MKASELRAKAEGVLKSRTPTIPEDLKHTINRAASEGCFYCRYYGAYLPSDVVQALRDGGLAVEYWRECDGGPFYKISW